ncbi:MAG: DNA repair protein RadA [Nitrospirota bacterium]|nr:MAG: DNA repair protein RadA [Nitrospirota bacterium]
MKAARPKTRFVCQECGFQGVRWSGRCPECAQWNSLREEVERNDSVIKQRTVSEGTPEAMPIGAITQTQEFRLQSGIEELNRVLGGGLVPGSVVLIGGDPGIGKTTLLLQTLNSLEKTGEVGLYVSGEESPQQIKMRADRLGIHSPNLYVVAATSLEEIFRVAEAVNPRVMVVDSIQTVFTSELTSAPGSVSQVQEVGCRLMWYAKRTNVPVFIIGHVTKEGVIAGPRLLEHIVDTVLYFEGDKGQSYRILRAVKNRFGPTNEIGVFEMKDEGLLEVDNPSAMFLTGRIGTSTGSVVVSSVEGSRPLLVELQALVSETSYPMPKRMAKGVEGNRVSLLLAVMEKRLGLHFTGHDVYVNVVGGLRIDEPTVDMGIVCAVLSSFRETGLDSRLVVMGEIGLGGEVRPVQQADLRIREAMKLGFTRCVVPEANFEQWKPIEGLDVLGIREIRDLWEVVSSPVG